MMGMIDKLTCTVVMKSEGAVVGPFAASVTTTDLTSFFEKFDKDLRIRWYSPPHYLD